MIEYKTIEEKSNEWGIPPKRLRALCRNGELKGAIKRAGAWFIPDFAMRPAVNAKSNGHHLQFRGTKRKIFEKSASLFAERSYENVSVKDIADEVGISQSAVYNHFKSKQEILDTIYDFYNHYYTVDRSSLAEQEQVLRSGSLTDIVNCVRYSFSPDYIDIMISCTKIVIQRLFIDERARELFRALTLDEGVSYIKAVLDRAVEIGRLEPFDTRVMAVFCNMNIFFQFLCWLTNPNPEYMGELLSDEKALDSYAVKFLTDKLLRHA